LAAFVSPPLDFDVMKEIWAKYELADNAVLKVKVILTTVTKTQGEGNPTPPPNYSLDVQTVVVVLTNERGPPDTRVHPPEQLNTAIAKPDIRFTTVTQDWNEYVVDDGTRIKIQPVLMTVSKTSFFNNKGLPIYTTSINMSVQIKPPSQVSPAPAL
jgi:hypothetical protein